MKHLIKIKPENHSENEKGSVTLEGAVVMTVFTTLLLLFISMFQIEASKNVLEMSVLRTADEMARWAPIYRNESIQDISDDILSKIGNEAAAAMSDIPLVSDIINMRNVYEYTADNIYSIAAQTLCSHFIGKDALIKSSFIEIESLNLYKSTFFHGDTNQFHITGECSVKTYMPFKIKLSYGVRCAAWGEGNMPSVRTEDGAGESKSIWSEDNFTRGKILRQMFGANLPDSFPVIAAFEKGDGIAVMIKSLDHTAKSYLDASVFEKTIKDMIDSLAEFNGAEYGGIRIMPEDIKGRRLTLVMPENEMTPSQEAALQSIMLYSMRKCVMLDLQRYQLV